MNSHPRLFLRLLVLCFSLQALAAPAQADEPRVIRMGLVVYEDFDLEFNRWQIMLAGWEKKAREPIEIRVALGTHNEVLHWLDHGWLDVAVLPPGTFAATMDTSKKGKTTSGYSYLATVGYPPATSPFAHPDQRKPGARFLFRGVCLVAENSPLRNLEDLRRATANGHLKYFFVNPFSTTGGVVPNHVLSQVGIKPKPEQIEYTFSHTHSLKLLVNQPAGEERVAFVWDDALRTVPELEGRVRKLTFPELDRLVMPLDAMIVRDDPELRTILRELVAGERDEQGAPRFQILKDHQDHYGSLHEWTQAHALSHSPWESRALSLDEIGWILLHSARSPSKPLRLAVVLSGGGAKCSYQVGVVQALEEKLAALRKQYPEHRESLDIQLVVGTSGGAINALPVALGLTRTPEGQATFRQVWSQLDQRDIVSPPLITRILLGTWLALLQFSLLLWLSRRFVKRASWHGWVIGWGLLALGLLQVGAFYLDWSPWRWLGKNHLWHHFWLVLSFSSQASAWFVLLVGLFTLFVHRQLRRRGGKGIPLPPRQFSWGLMTLLVAFPFAALSYALFMHPTLLTGTGMEQACSESFEVVVNDQLKREGKQPLALKKARHEERFRQISQTIFSSKLLKRDFVATGTCIEHEIEAIPADLYFYAQRDPRKSSPRFGKRGVCLNDHPERLLDVVMGSGSIFPVFPARPLKDFPRQGHTLQLIDGGFAHNVPVEGAVLWGATHVIVIEVSPEERGHKHTFVENVGAAFEHLHRETQQVDERSRKDVRVFTIAPQVSHTCLLDFADNLIEDTIHQGYSDSRGKGNANGSAKAVHRPFRETLGKPGYRSVK